MYICLFILMWSILSAIGTVGCRKNEEFRGVIFVAFIASLVTVFIMALIEEFR